MAAGLTERHKEIYEAIVGRLEAAAAKGMKISVQWIFRDEPNIGFAYHQWYYVIGLVKKCDAAMTARFDVALAATRTRGGRRSKAVELPPPGKPVEETEAEEEEEVEESEENEPEPEEAAAVLQPSVLTPRRHVEPVRPYTEVDCYLKNNAAPGTSEEEACANLGVDFGEYLLDKEKFTGSFTSAPLPPPCIEAYERVPQPTRPIPVTTVTRTPPITVQAPAPEPQPTVQIRTSTDLVGDVPELDRPTKTLAKVIMLLKLLPKEERDRVLGAASIMLGVD